MLIIIADSHILPKTDSERDFWHLMDQIAASPYDVCFAGDILELWIGLPQYEGELAQRFLDWCRREKAKRKIYFIEGNHEYFVIKHHADVFTETTQEYLKIGNIIVCHGDGLPGQNFSHRVFRAAAKSWLSGLLLHMPGAPAIVRFIKRKFEEAGQRRIKQNSKGIYLYPESVKAIQTWRKKWSGNEIAALFLGHFHCEQLIPDGDAIPAVVLPPWRDTKKFAIVDVEAGKFKTGTNLLEK